MSTLQEVRNGLSRAWNSIADGWRQLGERAGEAITKFNPIHRPEENVESRDALIERSASRWAILAAEVLESDKDIVVKLEAPGLDPEAFDIQILSDHVVIKGEKRIQRENTSGRYHVLECAYGAFERAIPLPATVDDKHATAQYRHGVLRVTLPKVSAAKTGRINVRVD